MPLYDLAVLAHRTIGENAAVPFWAIDEWLALAGYCLEPADLFEACLEMFAVVGHAGWAVEE